METATADSAVVPCAEARNSLANATQRVYACAPVGYSAEQAGATCARLFVEYSAIEGSSLNGISQTLATGHWMKVIDETIDLAHAIPKLNRHVKRQAARFMVDGYQPAKVNGKYPEPQALAVEVQALSAQEDTHGAALLSKELREVRACRAIATNMSGRRARAPLLTRADRRLRGKPCARCRRPLRLGQPVFHDRDWGTAWHSADGCHD